jgi:hypothetical protein
VKVGKDAILIDETSLSDVRDDVVAHDEPAVVDPHGLRVDGPGERDVEWRESIALPEETMNVRLGRVDADDLPMVVDGDGDRQHSARNVQECQLTSTQHVSVLCLRDENTDGIVVIIDPRDAVFARRESGPSQQKAVPAIGVSHWTRRAHDQDERDRQRCNCFIAGLLLRSLPHTTIAVSQRTRTATGSRAVTDPSTEGRGPNGRSRGIAGAGNGIRTRDPDLGKVVLYH